MKRVSDSLLAAFNDWFCSKGGVWQTLAITLVIVIAERFWPNLDPHGFWLLYWLTIYSAVTQPALAHSGRVAAEHNAQLIERLSRMEKKQAEIHESVKDGA